MQATRTGAGADRRSHTRFTPKGCDLSVVAVSSGLFNFLSKMESTPSECIVDLSQGGAHIVVRDRWAVGKRVRLTLNVHAPADALEFEGTVLWTRESSQRPGFWHAGVRFLRVDKLMAWKIDALKRCTETSLARLKDPRMHRGDAHPAGGMAPA